LTRTIDSSEMAADPFAAWAVDVCGAIEFHMSGFRPAGMCRAFGAWFQGPSFGHRRTDSTVGVRGEGIAELNLVPSGLIPREHEAGKGVGRARPKKKAAMRDCMAAFLDETV
jgi:hypothetical protein